MSDQSKLIGNEYFSQVFNDAVIRLKNGSGSIILLAGESGFGKSYLLNHYTELMKKQGAGVRSVFTEGQAPIGKFNLGNIQPLYPFSKAIEHYLEDDSVTPEKRFAKNVGLTVLASIPLIDTVFYAVKEIGRDWRQFKKEKSSEKAKQVSSATADYYDSLRSFADQMPLILFMDDMHWADSQSVELLTLIAENLKDLPLLIVVSYRRSMLEAQGLPLYSFVMNFSAGGNISVVELDSFNKEQIGELSALYFDRYKRNIEFEEWIHEHSYGVPGVATEYLKYFQKYPPFSPDGSLATNFKGNEFLPTTVQSVFTQHLESLSDEERNIIAVCSAEGREFTAMVVAHLLNSDILTTIKKLRALQTKTGIIRSIGPETRYGVKTTVYKFTQAFYHSYFENSLEYEEYTSLHGQIASLLKQKFEQTENDLIREEIAPYLAAHSAESGDVETAKSMLLLSAQHAQKYGSSDAVRHAFNKFSQMDSSDDKDKLNNLEFRQMLSSDYPESTAEKSTLTDSTDNNTQIFDSSIIDFTLYRKSIINDILSGKYESAVDKAGSLLGRTDVDLNTAEKAQLLTLQAKCLIEIHDFTKAEIIVNQANDLIKSKSDEQAECLVYNLTAQYYNAAGNMPKSYYFLDKSANLVSKLPLEMRLLTLANIAVITQKSSPDKAKEYMKAARKLSKSLNFDKLSEDLTAS
ncbi:MAG: AAA family ATPase [Candidatus Kapabacteria bacterium]|nr:AAA family ATPase [Candidatus Kapabacteria bacterium]